MSPIRTRSALILRLMQGLWALPFVLSQLLAQGTMLSAGMEVVLCSGDGPVTVLIAPDGSQSPAHQGDDTCIWALTPSVDGGAPVTPLVLARVALAESHHVPAAVLPRAVPALLLPEARAPPVLSV